MNGKSVLDLNVSFINHEGLVEKRMWTAVSLEGGTTGQELAEIVWDTILEAGVDPQKTMSISTDGCQAMLGELRGAVSILRGKIKTLPKWGGCADHDLANMLKTAVKTLCPELTNIFSAMFGCLNKHSMHKKRIFQGLEDVLGLSNKTVPKFIDVRFRVITRCCEWLLSQERAVYQYFTDMKDRVMAGQYEASQTEMIVLKQYLGNYLEVRLSCHFIIDVSKPVMDLISFFESSKVRIQDKHGKLVFLLYNYLSKFMKQAGCENNNPTGSQLLQAKFEDSSKQHGDKDIFLGSGVESLLRKLDLGRDSLEIKPWLLSVRKYYAAALQRMVKYFSASIESSTLRALSVLAPTAWSSTALDDLKHSWRKLACSFPNIIKVQEIPDLLTEVSNLKLVTLEDVDQKTEVDIFFRKLSKKVDEDDVQTYPLLVRLGQALSTIYNSSSPAERDFSLMNSFLADPHKNSTSLCLLLAKMHVKAECLSLARQCKKCLIVSNKGQQSSHCHCEQWKPSEDLMKLMRDGGPYQRYEEDRKQLEEKKKDEDILKEILKEEDMQKEDKDLKKESELLKIRNRKLKESSKRKKEEDNTKNKSKKKQKTPSKASLRREAQRDKLFG